MVASLFGCFVSICALCSVVVAWWRVLRLPVPGVGKPTRYIVDRVYRVYRILLQLL